MNKQSIILPWIAIALSITACIITFLDLDKAQITDDSFIGIMASFIGVIATILVGVQIFNSIETKQSIKELEKLHKKHIQEMNDNMREIENRLSCSIIVTQVSSIFDSQPIAALIYLHKGLEYALELEDKVLVENFFSDLKESYTVISKNIDINGNNYIELMSKEKEETIKEFKRLSIKKHIQNEIYEDIKEEYEQIIPTIKSTIITKLENYKREKEK